MVSTKFNKYLWTEINVIWRMHFKLENCYQKHMKNALRMRWNKTWHCIIIETIKLGAAFVITEVVYWDEEVNTEHTFYFGYLLLYNKPQNLNQQQPFTVVLGFVACLSMFRWTFCSMLHWLGLSPRSYFELEIHKMADLHIWQFSNGCWLGTQLWLLIKVL